MKVNGSQRRLQHEQKKVILQRKEALIFRDSQRSYLAPNHSHVKFAKITFISMKSKYLCHFGVAIVQ